MKQTRRQELKTNELSVILQQAMEAMRRNATFLIGGVVVVVLILVVGFLRSRSEQQATADAWSRYIELRASNVVANPDALDNARMLADEWGDDSQMGPRVLLLQAKLAHDLAMDKTGQEQLDLIGEARNIYQRVLKDYSNRAEAVAAARIGLVAADESLLVVGKGDIEAVRKGYDALSKVESGTFSSIVDSQLQTLDERLVPLEVVATRPAEESTTQPASATQPAAATQPVSTLPATNPAG